MRYTNLVAMLLISPFALLSTSSMAASFNCSKATGFVERSICQHETLSALDEQLNKVYQAELAYLKSQNGSAYNLANSKTQQKNWLRYQRNQCHSVNCIGREYQERINEIIANNTLIANTKNNTKENTKKVTRTFFTDTSAGKPPSFTYGEFTYQHKIALYDPTQSNEQLATATDAITILPIPKKPELAIIDVGIIGDNAHTCTLTDKKFTWRENHWALFENKSYGKNSSLDDIHCEFRVYPSKKVALIKDIDNQCQRLYCGVRAGFYDTLFKRAKD